MGEESLIRIVLAVIVGVLFGIVYSMRVLVLLERRIARIEKHIETLVMKTLKSEQRILTKLGAKPSKKSKTAKKTKKAKKKR